MYASNLGLHRVRAIVPRSHLSRGQVSLLDLSHVARLQREHLGCRLLHDVLDECGCVHPQATKAQLATLDGNVRTLNGVLADLSATWTARLRHEGRDDIAVVFQPFLNASGTNMDIGFLSKLDCFHPSTEGHRSFAIGLWNSMLGEGSGGSAWPPKNLTAACPTRESVFYTPP